MMCWLELRGQEPFLWALVTMECGAVIHDEVGFVRRLVIHAIALIMDLTYPAPSLARQV